MSDWTLLTQHSKYKAGTLLKDEVGDPIASLIASGAPLVPSNAALQALAAQVMGDLGGPSDPEWMASAALAARTCVLDEGVVVNARPSINFIGAAVAAADDPTNNRINVTIDAAGVSGWTHAAGLITETVVTDDVVIGDAAPLATEKLRVLHADPTGPMVEFEMDHDGAVGAILSLFHDSDSPAALDVVGRVSFQGRDDVGPPGAKTEYARVDGRVIDPTAGAAVGWFVVGTSWNTDGAVHDNFDVSQYGTTLTGYTAAAIGPAYSTVFAKGAAGAANDVLGTFYMTGIDDASAPTAALEIAGVTTDAAAATYSTRMRLRLSDTSVWRVVMTVDPDVTEWTHTDDGALGPTLSLYHVSTTPGDLDVVGRVSFFGADDAVGLNKTEYVRLDARATDVSDGTEDGAFYISVVQGGTLPTTAATAHYTLSSTGSQTRGLLSATTGPEVGITFGKGAAGAANDVAGYVGFWANDDASALKEIGYWTCDMPDAAAASVTGRMRLNLLDDNVDTLVFQVDSCDVAEDTCLMLYLNDGGVKALRRVVMGADDSGGAGFRLLRVAN